MTISKIKMAIGVVAVFLLGTTTAMAANPFTDVPDGQFYTEPVDWAFNNDITTGTSATTFSPVDNVTRGQNVTFAYRYDQNIVQPKFDELDDSISDLESDVSDNAENIATVASDVNNATRVHFARVASDGTVEKTGNQAIEVERTTTGAFDVTLPEAATNCAITTSLYYTHGGGLGGLGNLSYNNEALIWADRASTDDAEEITVFIRDADDGATTDGDTLPDPVDLDFTITATCSDPVFIFDPGIIIPPIIIIPSL